MTQVFGQYLLNLCNYPTLENELFNLIICRRFQTHLIVLLHTKYYLFIFILFLLFVMIICYRRKLYYFYYSFCFSMFEVEIKGYITYILNICINIKTFT